LSVNPLIVRASGRAKHSFDERAARNFCIMKIRTRKLLGTVALLLLALVWSLMGMTLAQTTWLANSGLLQAIFYVVVGMGWVLPAMPLISWMSRPDA
jgi:uncharacterized protein DUF2842